MKCSETVYKDRASFAAVKK